MKSNGVLKTINDNDTTNLLHNIDELDSTFEKDEKIRLISYHFRKIMEVMGLDLDDDSLRDTPARVARMYVNEIFSGLDPANEPAISLFENKYAYKGMIVERNITVHSWCEHHFVPITGKAHVAYIAGEKVIGLSKLNRIVHYYCSRPQVQERLTEDIAAHLKKVLDTPDVAVVIDAVHHCVASRGIADVNSSTYTAHYSGQFLSDEMKKEFLSAIR